jgi:hypothetical protein
MAVTDWASDHEGASSCICMVSRSRPACASSTRVAKSGAARCPPLCRHPIGHRNYPPPRHHRARHCHPPTIEPPSRRQGGPRRLCHRRCRFEVSANIAGVGWRNRVAGRFFEFAELGWRALPIANQHGFAGGIHVEQYVGLFASFGDPAAILPKDRHTILRPLAGAKNGPPTRSW